MIRLGVIGLGAAGQAFLPAICGHPAFRLAAVCDARAEAAHEAGAIHGVPAFTAIPALVAAGGLDAVYVGTPTDLHPEHASRALEAGLHVLLEKPVAVTLEEALALAGLARRCGRVLLIGHSHSHDLPIRTMREIIASGRLGAPRMIHTWCFTDWVYRPRRPEELRPELGGGVTFRQGAHQFDILRALAMAPAESVRAMTFDWDAARPTVGAHTALVTFANGAVGTAVYNGYGRFQTPELTGGIGEWGFPFLPPAMPVRSQPAGSGDEIARKQARARTAIGNDAPHQPQFGLTVVSCEGGDLRQSPDGILVYSADGREEIRLPVDRSPRHLVLDEFAAAIGGAPVLHDGDHGAAITEICVAVHRSAGERREIALRHQRPEGRGDHGHALAHG